MNKEWLEAFICVAKTNSISKAAEILYLTQPAVSTRIQALENDLEEKLFLRTSQKMILTHAGHLFIPHAEKMFHMWDEIKQVIHKDNKEIKGTLVVSIFYAGLFYFTPFFISFLKKYPHVKLVIKTDHSDQVQSLVLNRFAHIGITRSTHHVKLNLKKILSYHFVLVTHPSHHLAQTDQVNSPLNIKDEQFAFLYTSNTDRRLVAEYFKHFQDDPYIAIETDNISVCMEFVKSGLGVSLLPDFMIKKELEQQSLIIIDNPKHDFLKRDINLIWDKSNDSNPIIHLFNEHLYDELFSSNCNIRLAT